MPALGGKSSSTGGPCWAPARDGDIRRPKIKRSGRPDVHALRVAKACQQDTGGVGSGAVEDVDIFAIRERQGGALSGIPGNKKRRRPDLLTHHFAKRRGHHTSRRSCGPEGAIEEPNEYIFASALEGDEKRLSGMPAGCGDGGSDSFKIAHADDPSTRGESYPARRRQPDADPGETARPNAHGDEIQRGGRQPRLTHRRVDDRQ